MPGAVTTDSIGPVDVAVITFEGNRFNGEVAPALLELEDNGTVRIIDVTFVRKEADGTVSVTEVADSDVADAYQLVKHGELDLLSQDDLTTIASGLPSNSSAMVIVWENSWAARLGAAIRASHGQVVALERIPRHAVLEAYAELDRG